MRFKVLGRIVEIRTWKPLKAGSTAPTRKVNDVVNIKPRDWYLARAMPSTGKVYAHDGEVIMTQNMSRYCGQVRVIQEVLGNKYVLFGLPNTLWSEEALVELPKE